MYFGTRYIKAWYVMHGQTVQPVTALVPVLLANLYPVCLRTSFNVLLWLFIYLISINSLYAHFSQQFVTAS